MARAVCLILYLLAAAHGLAPVTPVSPIPIQYAALPSGPVASSVAETHFEMGKPSMVSSSLRGHSPMMPTQSSPEQANVMALLSTPQGQLRGVPPEADVWSRAHAEISEARFSSVKSSFPAAQPETASVSSSRPGAFLLMAVLAASGFWWRFRPRVAKSEDSQTEMTSSSSLVLAGRPNLAVATFAGASIDVGGKREEEGEFGGGHRNDILGRLLPRCATAAAILESIGATEAPSEMEGKVVVVKYGGHAMKDEAGFAKDLVALQSLGVRPVVVHGGGPQIKAMLEKLEMESKFVQGLRVSDKPTVEVAEMVLGRLNKCLVAAIVNAGGRAVGLSGKDDGMIKARRVTADGGVDIGFVGEAEEIDTTLMDSLLAMSPPVIPVVAPIGVGADDGETYNINADTMAGDVAGALRASRLLLLTDVPGVLDAAPPEGNLIPKVSRTRVDELISDGTVTGGMIPKLQNALAAVSAGAGGAAIVDGREPHALFRALYSAKGGTLVEEG